MKMVMEDMANSGPISRQALCLIGAAVLAVVFALPVRARAPEPGAPQPRKLALLIGASHYVHLPAEDQLKGPDNDIVLMRGLLADRGFQVTQLGGAANPIQPTRAAIISAMQKMAQMADKGDFVFLLFSGHGSQQPEGAAKGYPSKPDGMDETILPVDVDQWDGATGTVKGVLLDHEVGSLINAIRNKGAFVWSVFDSCHSATMTRAARVGGERDRRVLPGDLGVPTPGASKPSSARTTKTTAAATSFIAPVPLQPGAGGWAAFYAAQTAEETPELALPENSPDRKVYGLFSFSLAQAISSAPSASYRQLAQHILQAYTAMNRESPTPLFEGDLDQPAFGSGSAAHPQWQVQSSSNGLTLTAGILNEVGTGALLLVLPSPTAPDDQAIGVVRVEQALETTSHVVWVSDTDSLQRAGWVRAGSSHPPRPPDGAFARLVASGLDFNVQVALPLVCHAASTVGAVPACAAGGPGTTSGGFAIVSKALDAHAVGFPPNVSMVDPRAVADIRPLLYHDRLWLAPPGGQLVKEGPAQTFSIAVTTSGASDPSAQTQSFTQSLYEALGREARAINLARLSAQPGMTNAVGLKVSFTVSHMNGSGVSNKVVSPGEVPSLSDGDQMTFLVTNQGTQLIDVTMLDIGARFGIAPVYPLNGESNRLKPGDSVSIPGTIDVNDDTSGRDTMLVIAVPVQPEQEWQDFSGLAQKSLEADRSAKGRNGPTSGGVTGLLWQAAFGGGAGMRVLRTNDPAQIVALSWTTSPRSP